MIRVERHPIDKLPKLERTDELDHRMVEDLFVDLEDALTSRMPIEGVWVEARRQYNAIPKRPIRNVPVPNAPNIEVPVGAILADDLAAQAVDTLFTASPLVSIRASQEKFVEHAKSTQVWIDRLIASHLDLQPATTTMMLDDTQLGTGFLYVPYLEDVVKQKAHKVTRRGPKIICITPEDVIVMPGSRGNLQEDRWVAIRHWYTPGEMRQRARMRNWKIDDATPVARVDMVRMQYENAAKVRTNSLWRELYEVIEIYAHYDYDQDGFDEDILVTIDRPSRTVLDVTFNPYDKRPLIKVVYQERPHLPYGIGVMEMSQPFQEETTELHCAGLLNVFLANCRFYAALAGALPEDTEIYPGAVLQLANATDVREAFQEVPMSEVHPSAMQSQVFAIGLAERRVGANGSQGFMQKGGSRTPGVTAMALLQQVNRRFAPAFMAMREASTESIRFSVQRYRERVMAKDADAIADIKAMLSPEDADLVLEMLTTDDISQSIVVEFTAASASVNRDADRQNSLLLAQLLDGYYTKTVELAGLAIAPETTDTMRAILIKVAEKGNEIMERTIRTFEQVRDPKTFLVQIAEELDSTIGQAGVEGGMGELLTALLQAGAAQEGVPQEPFAGVA